MVPSDQLRSFQRLFDRPSAHIYSAPQRRYRKAGHRRPLFHRVRDATMRQHPRISTIICLFDRIGPPAIAWLVVAVIVDAVEGRSRGPRSHVIQEDGEVSPWIAYP